jgi:SAM-dependent methyltransferase
MAKSPTIRERLRRGGAYALGVTADLSSQASHRLREADHGSSLQGDRWVEWSFCFARMTDGPGRTLDFGADIGFLSLASAQRGHDVVAFDRLPSALDYTHPSVRHVQADILTHDFGDERFDQIVNCSSVEHVGLGGRYGSFENEDGDLEAMTRLRRVLVPGGRHLLTIPVGRDGVFAPQHRVYGPDRLPRLLDGYTVSEEQYWTKQERHWTPSDRATALDVQGSAAFYALGLFVLSSP